MKLLISKQRRRELVKQEAELDANVNISAGVPCSVCETAFKEENRCCACGCFMEGFDCSTEAADNYDFKCNNKKCPSNNRLI